MNGYGWRIRRKMCIRDRDMYYLDEHVEKIKDVYRKRRDVMLKTMEETFPKEVKFTHPEGCLLYTSRCV